MWQDLPLSVTEGNICHIRSSHLQSSAYWVPNTARSPLAKETLPRDHRKCMKNKHFTHCRCKAALKHNTWVLKPSESLPPLSISILPAASRASPSSWVGRERSPMSSVLPCSSTLPAHCLFFQLFPVGEQKSPTLRLSSSAPYKGKSCHSKTWQDETLRITADNGLHFL